LKTVVPSKHRKPEEEEEGKGKNGCFTPTYTEAY
jgi:hypothetical protein